ncbi:MAG: hypothetical protein JW931_00375 [Methanomicrobiaceae archaeon]|nr:hypothetical protein [Methanomicrobiaceae archaeon]
MYQPIPGVGTGVAVFVAVTVATGGVGVAVVGVGVAVVGVGVAVVGVGVAVVGVGVAVVGVGVAVVGVAVTVSFPSPAADAGTAENIKTRKMMHKAKGSFLTIVSQNRE